MKSTLRYCPPVAICVVAGVVFPSAGCRSSIEFTRTPSRSITGSIMSADTPFPRGYEQAKPGPGLKMSDVKRMFPGGELWELGYTIRPSTGPFESVTYSTSVYGATDSTVVEWCSYSVPKVDFERFRDEAIRVFGEKGLTVSRADPEYPRYGWPNIRGYKVELYFVAMTVRQIGGQ